MRKVVLCVFALLAILFGAVLGVLYPPNGATRLIKNNTPLPHTQLNQTPSPSSTRLIDLTEEDEPTTPSSSEVNGYNSPLPSKSPIAAYASDEDPAKTAGGVLGQLIVNNQSVNIYCGIDEGTLKNGPGWMPESALPGKDGMSVILGHRNRNHLKILENVLVGDEIVFGYLNGRSISYSVTDVQIFEKSADWVLPQPDGNMLVVVTCYPFRYSGSAPGKFQAVCKRFG
ncbi:MAG TPA: class D sortase [Clostridia bacterium]|nr:class D sortase [Clostridia bacterium]